MAVVKVVEYNGPDPHEALAWKFVDGSGRSDELGTWTQLVVREGQQALLFRDGRALDLFGPGRHTLSTDNIPLLRDFVSLPFGGKSPFKAEVWYINTVHSLDVKWGTTSPIQIQDPRYGVFLPVRAYGQFGIRVDDGRKFLVKLVGAAKAFDREALVGHFRGLLVSRIKDLISTFIVVEKRSILELNAHLNAISAHMETTLAPALEAFGLTLVNFFVTSVNVPEEDPAVAQLKSALARRAELEILGTDYRQQRSFDVLDRAAANEGGGGTMQAGMGLGMGFGIGGALGASARDLAGDLAVADVQPCPACGTDNARGAAFCSRCGQSLQKARTGRCSACSAPLQPEATFCPACGRALRRCASCGSDVPDGSARCPDCGAPQPIPCPHCQAPVTEEMRFCPRCGKALTESCPGCGTPLPREALFCPRCGHKVRD